MLKVIAIKVTNSRIRAGAFRPPFFAEKNDG